MSESTQKRKMYKTKRHISFPSIMQYRTTLTSMLKTRKRNPEMSPLVPFIGTVKLHGTNAGVCYNTVDGMWCQSRSNIIDLTYDNAGFACHIHTCNDLMLEIFRSLSSHFKIDLGCNTLAVYGEWCGGNIQKNVAICSLPKMFVIFGVKCISHSGGEVKAVFPRAGETEQEDAEENTQFNYWLDFKESGVQLNYPGKHVYCIYSFPTYNVTIDLDEPRVAQSSLSDLTLQVEAECPVAKALGAIGIGEGLVWEHMNEDGSRWLFKTKGEKHSATRVKTIAPVDLEKVGSVKQFVECTVTETRFNQALEHIYRMNPALPTYGQPYDMKHVQKVIEWVRSDVIKEDIDMMTESGLTPKDIIKDLSNKVVFMFKELIGVSGR